MVVSRLKECGGAEVCKTVCAARARDGRIGFLLRAGEGGAIEGTGRLLIIQGTQEKIGGR